MGFYITIDEDKSRLLRNLRLNPSEVFGTPYGGYLLFLVGGADEDVLTWLTKNVSYLDSLTGSHIAFGIFARNIKLRMHVEGQMEHGLSRAPRTINIPLHEIQEAHSIKDVFRSEKYGMVIDGDEINAITYGTDVVAEAFGVLGDLPCVLAMDAVPKNRIEVIRLDNETTSEFIRVLRSSIQTLVKTPGYRSYMQTIYRVIELQRRSDELQRTLNEAKQRLSQVETDKQGQTASVTTILSEFRKALLRADLRSFFALCRKKMVRAILGEAKLDRAAVTVDELSASLVAYATTIRSLNRYSTVFEWPLVEPANSRYLHIYHTYVRPMLDNSPENASLDSRSQCVAFKEQLTIQQTKLVDEIMIMTELSSTSELEAKLRDQARAKIVLINEQIRMLQITRQQAEAELMRRVSELYDLEQPSFVDLLTKELKLVKIRSTTRQVRNGAAAYASSWLRPETLVEVWKSLTTA